MRIQLGRVVRRVCGRCDLAIEGDTPDRACPRCQAGLIEIRAAADDAIGQLVDGRYEIRDKLGEGGMGTVYRAWQASVKREVAIKLMATSFASDPMAVTRFEREAQLASRLSQPNTVSVLDFGKTSDGRLFIAMELIRGRNLLELIRADGALAVERVIRIGTQICDALEAAHGLGIIHRDLKLENVIVLDDPPGRDLVKVLDFGLAKLVDDPRGTAAGVVVGTPRYLAPETVMDGKATQAADMYAVGVILAELALGRPLWDGDDLAELLEHKRQPRAVIAPVPATLRRVVAGLIDPSPEHRPTAAQVRVALASPDVSLPAPPTERATVPMKASRPELVVERAPIATAPKPSSAPRIVLAISAVALVVGGIGFALGRGAPAPPSTSSPTGASKPAAPSSGSAIAAPLPAGSHDAPAPGLSPTATGLQTPADARAPDTILFHIRSKPDGVDIKIAGKAAGKTPLDVPLPRSHTSIWVDGWRGPKLLSRSVAPDRERDVVLDFTVSRAWDADRSPPPEDAIVLHVRSKPTSALVVIDHDHWGLTPIDVRVARGTKSLWVAASWEDEIRGVTVVPDHDQDVEIEVAADCAAEILRPRRRGCRARFCADHPDDVACASRAEGVE